MNNTKLRKLVRAAKADAKLFASQLDWPAQSNVLVNGKVTGWSEDSTRSLVAAVRSNRKRFGL